MRLSIAFLVVIFLWTASAHAQQKTLYGYFPFNPPATLEEWEERRAELRRQILVSQGLWPMPEKTDLNPIVHNPIERDEYTVYGVILEVVPGYFLTGNLYVPKNITGQVPGILSPHGHWGGGRFHQHSERDFTRELETGGEIYDPSGRFPLQARCVTLARLGCIVFHFDTFGNADSIQLPVHYTGVREYMNTKENWGFHSPQAELRLQGVMGLQTLASIRALDWLESLPQVDPNRIAITGASGGGTQSFILAAIDDRIAVSFPAVMVSTGMQGGCPCENANYLRVGTGNVEIAALFAPKPQGLTTANDWTREMATSGFPQLQQLYALYDAKENVALFEHLQHGHNFNFPSRADMYRFMNEHLNLGHDFGDEPIERPFVPLTIEEMTVWTGEHTRPTGDQVGDVFERRLLREMNERSNAQLSAMPPQERNEIVRGALETMIGWKVPGREDLVEELDGDAPTQEDYGWKMKGRIIDERSGVTASFSSLFAGTPMLPGLVGVTCVFVSKNGTSDFFNEEGQLIDDDLAKLLSASLGTVGFIILDLQGQGGDNPLEKAPLVVSGNGQEAWHHSLAYTYGYNPTIFAKRVQGLLAMLTHLAETKPVNDTKIVLFGLKGGAPYATAARALMGDTVDKMIVDTEGFRFANITSFDDVKMLPGIVKYGDLPAILALSDPATTEIRGEE